MCWYQANKFDILPNYLRVSQLKQDLNEDMQTLLHKYTGQRAVEYKGRKSQIFLLEINLIR